jgi:hypothetical protein
MSSCCRCLIDKQRKTKVVLETLALIEIMMRESSDAEMHCIMKEREFGYLLFEMLSLEMHEEVISVLCLTTLRLANLTQ